MKFDKLKRFYGIAKVRVGLLLLALLAVVGSAQAEPPDPTDAIVSAVEASEAMAQTVMTAAGGIMVALAILGGLWMLGVKWSRRAAKGG